MEKKEQFRFLWERAMILQPDIQPTTKHVLLTLAVFMDEKATCFPSVSLLSERTGLSRRCVCEHLEKANKAGWIKTSLAGHNEKGWKRHKYLAVMPNKVVTQDNHVNTEGGYSDAEGGYSNDIKVVTQGHTNTIVNTTNNTTIFSQNSDELRLAELLYALLLKINPGHKKPNLQTWAKHIDLAIRVDKRMPDEIEKVMRWALADSFWQGNIQSTKKLRKQFDALTIKMRQKNGTSIQNAGQPTTEPGKYDSVPELVVDV